MARWIRDDFAKPLAQRLSALKAESLYRDGITLAGEDIRDELTMELSAEGAPSEVAEAISVFPVTSDFTGSVGVKDDESSTSEAAENWEFGSLDGTQRPHGTFAMMSLSFADYASAEIADALTGAVVG